ncbi:hypothetical protein A4A49_06594 [Nicotiana attenuata]|uniref:Uncharacterized protein n=1 Tax=Nicotiana attenuata TaxID=49451 RepID=A0A314KXT3_NICAT|nr:hypothetical protein A4A49_06594 [Nicotiana attenuata]
MTIQINTEKVHHLCSKHTKQGLSQVVEKFIASTERIERKAKMSQPKHRKLAKRTRLRCPVTAPVTSQSPVQRKPRRQGGWQERRLV